MLIGCIVHYNMICECVLYYFFIKKSTIFPLTLISCNCPMKKSPFGNARLLYLRLFVYVKPFWPVLLLGVLTNIFYSAIDAGLTYMMRPFLDKGFIDIDMVFV